MPGEQDILARGGAQETVWTATTGYPDAPRLSGDERVQVCIVGAGIAGMTTAYLLAREGLSVTVVDDGLPGSGMTGRTTAHLSNAIDDRYMEIERVHGEHGSRLAAGSHTAAINLIEETVRRENINCDFERLDGFLLCPEEESPDVLQQELEAAHRAGLLDVEAIEPPVRGFRSPALRFPRQGQFHPLEYIHGLVDAFRKYGGTVFTGAHVDSIDAGTPAHVHTGRYTVTADSVVVATNSPINDRVVVHTKQAPYMTYVIALRARTEGIRRALYWDTLDPYHYVRFYRHQGTDLLIAGGEDHKTGQDQHANVRYAMLESWVRDRFPVVGDVKYRWSGQVMESLDGLGFIGRNPLDGDNIYIATGDSGMGMTHGTIAGMLLRDMILNRGNPWSSLYDPSRVPLAAGMEFVRENLNVAVQYADFVTAGDITTAEEVRAGHGAVIRRGLTKVAVYRDRQGALHELSAVCTHLGCIVAWNDDEKTWDCPCHGSRYDPFGAVINGPASSGLKPVARK